ncbi:MAG: arylsulfatase [Pseudomonadota bacterium]
MLILADDMGYGDLAVQNPESQIPTPSLDALAAEGVRFTDAHSPSAVCSPTRYGILTGRYSWRTRLQRGVLFEWERPLIEPERLTLPKALKERGYHTALIGKWHIGWEWPGIDGYQPKRGDTGDRIDFDQPLSGGPLGTGFDSYFGDDVPNYPPYTFIENDRVLETPTLQKPASMFGAPGVMAPNWKLDAVMPAIRDRSIAYIESRGSRPKQPFFLFVSLTAQHTPIAPAAEFQGHSNAGAYGDYVFQLDQMVGALIDTLKATGLDDNTLVMFTSDNGSPARDGEAMSGGLNSVRALGHNPSRPWRGIKGDAWEGGHRVPFLARWPGQIAGDRVSDRTISLVDSFATLAEITGTALAEDAAEDSASFASALTEDGSADQNSREAIVLHSDEGYFVVRQENWKLILGCGSGGFSRSEPCQEDSWQLYDLAADPGETSNVLEDHPAIAAKMATTLEHYQADGRSVYRGSKPSRLTKVATLSDR